MSLLNLSQASGAASRRSLQTCSGRQMETHNIAEIGRHQCLMGDCSASAYQVGPVLFLVRTEERSFMSIQLSKRALLSKGVLSAGVGLGTRKRQRFWCLLAVRTGQIANLTADIFSRRDVRRQSPPLDPGVRRQNPGRRQRGDDCVVR